LVRVGVRVGAGVLVRVGVRVGVSVLARVSVLVGVGVAPPGMVGVTLGVKLRVGVLVTGPTLPCTIVNGLPLVSSDVERV